MMGVADVIETMKEAEQPGPALLVLDSRRLARLVAVWPMVPCERVYGYDLVCEPYWENLWRKAAVPVEGVARILRCSVGEARSLLDQAIAARLIYPDGTVHDAAGKAVQKLARDSLRRN